MNFYNNNFSKLRIRNVCKLAGVKFYRLPSVKGFDGENRQLHMCNMFTLKQCRNKICKMAHFLSTEMEKSYPEKLANMLITGVTVAVKTPKEEKGDDYPEQPRVPFPASGG